MNAPRPRTAAALLALAASACGAASDAGDAPGDANRAPDDAAAQTWSLVEELRIGSADDPEASLTAVPHRGLAVGPQGHIYVAQRQDEQIRVYDRDGHFVRAFGGKGNGPGEFTHLFAIGILADTVYAVNAQPARLSFFTLQGEHIETTLLAAPPADDYAALLPAMLFPDGTGVASRFFTAEAVASGRVRMVPTHVTQHELLHALGFEHTCFFPTVLAGHFGPRQLERCRASFVGRPDDSPAGPRITVFDVAHIELALMLLEETASWQPQVGIRNAAPMLRESNDVTPAP